MEKGLFTQINQYFSNRQYQVIPTDIGNVAMYGTYDQSNLYLINVIQLGHGYAVDIDGYLEYKQLTMEQFGKNQADKVILLNIILSEEVDDLYETFNYVPDLSEKFIDVLWLIDEKENTLRIPKKQLKNILGIDKDLKKILNKETTTYYKLEPYKGHLWMTWALMILNVLIWAGMEIVGSSTDTSTLINAGAMSYDLVAESGDYYRLITAMFLHIGFFHLFYNMFSLYIFGSRLESYLKKWQFIAIYLGAGFIGSLSSMSGAFITGVHPVSAGASGAVYGLIGSLLVVSRKVRAPIEGITTYILWVMFVLGIVFSIVTPNIDMLAHLGGFIGGVVLTLMVLKRKQKIDTV